LACALRAHQAAVQRTTELEERLAEERQRTDAVLEAERLRLRTGSAPVADLLQAQRYAQAAEERKLGLSQRVQAALRDAAEAKQHEDAARQALAKAEADRSALERHRERFTSEVERERENAAEEAGTEIWQHRQRNQR
jgi:hypothetical protein